MPDPNPQSEPLTVREQLALFAPTPVEALPDVVAPAEGLGCAQRLARLLAGDLGFHDAGSDYASHALHAFAAKFPPQLPRWFIEGLSQPGDVVLDPMMGSGTAVVEAVLAGRVGVGVDIDPLALRLTRVKTRPLDLDATRQLGNQVLRRARAMLADDAALEQGLTQAFDARTRAFADYWFLPRTQRELWALATALREVGDPAQRGFLELVFSAIIVTKSGGVSLARDLAHTRPHLDKTKVPRSALDEFAARLAKGLRSMAALVANSAHALILDGDARAMPLATESVRLVVTSPPYANAIDYMRAHKFSLVWLGSALDDLSALRGQYIGAERLPQAAAATLPPNTEDLISRLAKLDAKKAQVLRKYYAEMRLVLRETYRVLRHDAAAVVVIGTSTMRGLNVETHTCLAELGVAEGLQCVGIAERKLDRNRRMLPARFGRKTDSMIEQRMHAEYVIGFLKT